MSDKIKNFCISVDGMPFSGKTTVCNYLKKLTKTHLILDDGIVKAATLARCAGKAEPDYQTFKDCVVVYLLAVKEDWNLRCQNLEVANRFDEISAEMNKTAQMLDDAGVRVLVYNTSKYTPYLIAKDIMKVVESNNDSKPSQVQPALSSEN